MCVSMCMCMGVGECINTEFQTVMAGIHLPPCLSVKTEMSLTPMAAWQPCNRGIDSEAESGVQEINSVCWKI